MGYNNYKQSIVFIMIWMALAMALVTMPPQVDPETARQTLTADGYVDIVLAKRNNFTSFFAGCGKQYSLITPFEATLMGHRARGVVCSGGETRQAPQVRRDE